MLIKVQLIQIVTDSVGTFVLFTYWITIDILSFISFYCPCIHLTIDSI